jgi:hypothetical protein
MNDGLVETQATFSLYEVHNSGLTVTERVVRARQPLSIRTIN